MEMASDDLQHETSPRGSPPLLPPDSPGSSLSSRFQDEYNELMKYAVILPSNHESEKDSTHVSESGRDGSHLGAFQPVGQSLNLSGSLDRRGFTPIRDVGLDVDQDTNTNAKASANSKTNTPKKVPGPCGSRSTTPRSKGSKPATPTASNQNTVNPCGCGTTKTGAKSPQGCSSVRKSKDPPKVDQDVTVDCALVDPAVRSMACKLDEMLGTLKTELLCEVGRSTVHALKCQLEQMSQAKKSLLSERQQLQQEINRLAELVDSHKETISRKETLVENLTTSLAQQKEKVHQALAFYNWRTMVADRKREAFTTKLAVAHHNRQLYTRVFKAWFGVVQCRWKCQVQRECEAKAQNVCRQLSADYEVKIAKSATTIAALEQKVADLQTEREKYMETVKKAFMRGVCALNMEAMSAFTGDEAGATEATDREGEEDSNMVSDSDYDVNFNSSNTAPKDDGQAKSLPPDLMTPMTSGPFDPKMSQKPSHSLPSFPNSQPLRKSKPKSSQGSRVKSATTRPRSPAVGQGQALAPPMASVVVERHQPVTKQTVGKATALRYPKTGPREGERTKPASYAPLAGQTLTPSIKVVD